MVLGFSDYRKVAMRIGALPDVLYAEIILQTIS